MNLCYILFAAIIAVSQAASTHDETTREWIDFKAKFNKSYDAQEEINRKKTFIESYKKVKEHNKKFEKRLATFKLELNRFSDIPVEELSQSFLEDTELSASADGSSFFISPTNVTIPDSINWVMKGAITPVKQQGQCGSCWAFSAIAALESQTFIKTGKLVSLSEQNVIDCIGNYSCNGGRFMTVAFDYVKNNGGIDTEDSYPYEAKVNACRYNLQHNGSKSSGYVWLKPGNETELKTAVATVGPISVAFLFRNSFYLYKEGIYSEPECSNQTDRRSHAALLVGYGTHTNGKDYWLLKNSWGATWGDKGYFKMARNENMCGIANWAVYPVV